MDSAAALGDAQERLVAALLALGRALGLGVLLGLLELALGLLQPVAQVAGVEVARLVRLLDEHQRALGRDLEISLALGEADDVGVGLVEAQLGGIEHRQQRLVMREDADRADRRAGREHLDLVIEDLALGREDLDVKRRVGHYWSSPSPLSSPPVSGSPSASDLGSSDFCSSPFCSSSSLDSSPLPLPLSTDCTTSSMVPFSRKALSGRSSCSPSRISLK